MNSKRDHEICRKKEVLHIGPDLSSHGGIAAVLNSYAHHRILFEERGYLITFAASCGRRGLGQIWQFAVTWARVVFGALTGRIDIVHLHTSVRGSLLRKWLFAMTCLLIGKKFIVHVHSGAIATYVDRSSKIKKSLIWMMFRRASAVVCLSEAMHKWMLECGQVQAGKCALIYNGIAIPLIEYREKIKIGEEVSVIYLGKLSREKGIFVLIAAADELKKLGCRFKLILGGNGDVSSILTDVENRGLSESVEYLGWVTGLEKKNLLDDAEIFVLPSQSEGFPVSLVEAMAYETAIVSTNIPGVIDAVRNEVDGLLVEYGDVSQLSQTLKRLIDDSALRSKLSASAKKRFLEKFTTSIMIKNITSLYASVSK